MKKRCLTLGLALALCALSACTPAAAPGTTAPATQTVTPTQSPASPPPSPTETGFVFTRENLPRLDGSTSTVPLGQAICSVLLGESREDVADLVQFSRTTASYQALMNGTADLLIAGEPEGWVMESMRSGEWLLTPFATDALAFIVSPDNPVDSITAAQARDIYAGNITSWKELGGEDIPIMPFQRNAEAGSQSLLKKLVMGDTPLMTPPADYIPTMGGMMEAVREFDGSSGAIGFTVYYYANDMKMAEGLKILSIDGVAPVADSIRDGSYPFLNPYYVAMAKDTAADSPTNILYNWILGPEGQVLVEHEGYVPGATIRAQGETKMGYIFNLDAATRSFDFDEIEWLTPEEDAERAAELGLSAEYDFPNGFYRYNESTDKVSCQIADSATFTFIDWRDHSYLPKGATFGAFAALYREYYDTHFKPRLEQGESIDSYTPYLITIADGLVVDIREPYVP